MSATAMARPLAAYEAIIAHAELELELAGNGEVEELAALEGRWEQLVAGLPDRPPAKAGPILERARLLHERTRIELIRLRESLLCDVATTDTAKRTAAGYGGHQTPGSRLDRSA
jgi:hypothetical protein